MRVIDEDDRGTEPYENLESLDDFFEVSNKPSFLEISVKNKFGYLEMEL